MSSQPVSSFDLEHNPFEQSFASKRGAAGGSGRVGGVGGGVVPSGGGGTGGSNVLPLPVLTPSYYSATQPNFFTSTSGLTPVESGKRNLSPLGTTPLGTTPVGGAPPTVLPLLNMANCGPGVTALPPYSSAVQSTMVQLPQLLQLPQPPAPVQTAPSRKRRFKLEHEPAAAGRAPSSGHNSADGGSDDQKKRHDFLERNRIAASKFRQRKKNYIKKIEADLKTYQQEYHQLSQLLEQLTPTVGPSASGDQPRYGVLGQLKSLIQSNKTNEAIDMVTYIENLINDTDYKKRNGNSPHEEQ